MLELYIPLKILASKSIVRMFDYFVQDHKAKLEYYPISTIAMGDITGVKCTKCGIHIVLYNDLSVPSGLSVTAFDKEDNQLDGVYSCKEMTIRSILE